MPRRDPRPTALFASATLAALLATAAAAAERTAPLDVGGEPARADVLNVRFAGQALSEGFVLRLAKKPVVDWGGIANADGSGLVEGELWFTVARDDGFVYYHLTDDPNPQTGPTAYGGYTVKIKGSYTATGYGLGAGADVPVIGNPHDGFLVTTTEVRLNSKFVPGPRVIGMATGTETFRLVHLADEVRAYAIPGVASAGQWAGWQMLAPDGSVLDEATTGSIASSSATSSCVAAAESARNFISTATFTFGQLMNLGMFAQNTASQAPLGGLGKSIVNGLTVGHLVDVQAAGKRLADDLTAPLYTALAAAACEIVAGTSDADLSLIEVELPSVEDVELVESRMKCLSYGDEAAGSSMVVTDDGIEVTGHTNRVCTAWVFVTA